MTRLAEQMGAELAAKVDQAQTAYQDLFDAIVDLTGPPPSNTGVRNL
jgi:hypothetical protein